MIRDGNKERTNMRDTATVMDDQKGTLRHEASPAPLPALSQDELSKLHAYWRACNYLAAGMIYLRANPLLREPLKLEHIKQRLLGHWGTSPGLSFIYIHLNRLIKSSISTRSSWPDRGTALTAFSRPHTSRAPTRKFIPTKARMRPGCASSLRSFP